ncbi:MAG: DivIVA domain-containing protein [Acidimicrobiia bacterium]|nr:DivIVA domain-containing protein [Acidimicrobiia bacterium]MDX2467931.1 DivIVA domain-containing protein [Acidimicrobiia bacterium]
MKLWTELEGAQFTLAVRGYDRDEVDDLLDTAVIGIREVEDRNSALHAKLKALESELANSKRTSSSAEHAFLDAVEKKQLMLADAEQRATEILATAESDAAGNVVGKEAEALRAQASLMLDQASAMLADAEGESVLIRSRAAADGEDAVIRIKAEAERMLAAAEAEAAGIVASAEQQHDRLAGALRLLQDSVAEMLTAGAERHEVIKVVLDSGDVPNHAADRGAAIA